MSSHSFTVIWIFHINISINFRWYRLTLMMISNVCLPSVVSIKKKNGIQLLKIVWWNFPIIKGTVHNILLQFIFTKISSLYPNLPRATTVQLWLIILKEEKLLHTHVASWLVLRTGNKCLRVRILALGRGSLVHLNTILYIYRNFCSIY